MINSNIGRQLFLDALFLNNGETNIILDCERLDLQNKILKEKVNILGVEHSRFALDLTVSSARLYITLETRNNYHAKNIIKKIELLGFSVIVKNTK